MLFFLIPTPSKLTQEHQAGYCLFWHCSCHFPLPLPPLIPAERMLGCQHKPLLPLLPSSQPLSAFLPTSVSALCLPPCYFHPSTDLLAHGSFSTCWCINPAAHNLLQQPGSVVRYVTFYDSCIGPYTTLTMLVYRPKHCSYQKVAPLQWGRT